MHGAWPALSSVLQNFSNFLVRILFEAVITTALGNFCKMIFETKKSIFLKNGMLNFYISLCLSCYKLITPAFNYVAFVFPKIT